MKGFKLANLPGVNHPVRKTLLNDLTKMEPYLEDLERGRPFFREEELIEIEEKFKAKGMTKNDILGEIYKKGWLFKENTLKHYIQINQIPRAERREKTKSGMISYYPATTIRHLNFIRYCLFSGSETTNLITTSLLIETKKDINILKAKSAESPEDPGYGCDDCIHQFHRGLNGVEDGIRWTKDTIEIAFANDLAKETIYLKQLNKIDQCWMGLRKEIVDFENLLERNTSPPELADLLADYKEEEGKDEAN